MFQYGQLSNTLFQLEHQHSDGTWGKLEPETEANPHDPAGLDPEQQWQRGHVYVCTSCQERVRVSIPEGERSAG
jgi:hypothetical protein